ncbi:hypothetical protein LUZ60_016080 [Juncus effusus]|nr:hypothetical protein LUZ60_016080 [Juncus effusus]
MKISNISLVVLLSTFFMIIASSSSNPTDFVRRSCKTTQYPDDCYKSLANYMPPINRSPRQLAYAALNVSVDRVRSVSTFVARMSARPKPKGLRLSDPDRSSEDGAVQDCMENLNDSLDLLRQSIHEMGRLGRANSARFKLHLSNVQTKVSAALTGETTCLDSASLSPAASNVIRTRVAKAAQATSNALALINQLI